LGSTYAFIYLGGEGKDYPNFVVQLLNKNENKKGKDSGGYYTKLGITIILMK